MKALIYAYSINYARELAIELIPSGIESFKTSSKEEVFIILEKEKEIKLLITENWEYEFLKKVKELNNNLLIYLLMGHNADSSIFMTLKDIGVHSCIPLGENVQDVADELVNSILKSNINRGEKRHFLRITPSKLDDFQSAIFLKEKRNYVRGRVLNISIGGFAMLPFDGNLLNLLEISRVYDPVFLSFQGMEIKTVSTLLAIRNGVCAFRFDNIEAKDRKKLASYIYDKLEEDIKELLKAAL